MSSQLSEEAALAEGAEILSRRKERLELEAKLRKRMGHSMVKEWMFWCGIAFCFVNSWNAGILFATPVLRLLDWLPAVLFILTDMEGAAMKREQALLEWIEYQKTKDQPSRLASDE